MLRDPVCSGQGHGAEIAARTLKADSDGPRAQSEDPSCCPFMATATSLPPHPSVTPGHHWCSSEVSEAPLCSAPGSSPLSRPWPGLSPQLGSTASHILPPLPGSGSHRSQRWVWGVPCGRGPGFCSGGSPTPWASVLPELVWVCSAEHRPC